MQPLSRTVARNSAVGLAAQIAIKVLSFSFSVVVVRTLGAETFGQYAAVLAFGAMFVFISDLGLDAYAVREVARNRDGVSGKDRVDSLYSNVLPVRFLLSLLAAVLLILAAWLTDRPAMMIGGIALGSLGLILYSVQGASAAVLAGFERLEIPAGAHVLSQLVFVVFGALALWASVGYYGLIVANILGIAAMTYVCWTAVRRLGVRYRKPDTSTWPALIRAGIPFGVIGFTLGISYKFDSVLLNVFRGDAETGYYSAGYNLVFAAVMLSNVINSALYPSLARLVGNAPDRLPYVYQRIVRLLMVLSLPMAVGGWALAEQIIPFLFKSAYLPAVPAFQIIVWVIPLMFLSEFLGYVLVIGGGERRVAGAVLRSTSFNVVANLLLIPRFGFVAAAATTVITESILVGQYLWMLRKTVPSLEFSRTVFRPLLAAAITGGLVIVLRDLPLLSNIALGAAAYALLLALLRVAGKEEVGFFVGLIRSRGGTEPLEPIAREPSPTVVIPGEESSPLEERDTVAGETRDAGDQAPRVGAVILNWHRPRMTNACLDSLAKQDYPVVAVVVDNGSSEDDLRAIRECHPEVAIIANGRNLGFAAGSNVGIAHLLRLDVDYVFLVNDDAELATDAVRRLVEESERQPSVGIVGPTIYYHSLPEVIWSAGGALTKLGQASHRLVGETARGWKESVREVDYVTGCAMLVRREVFANLGAFDERFFAYYEEAELCTRARRAGYRVLYVPRATVWHKVEPSARETSHYYLYLMARNRLLFLACNHAAIWVRVWAMLDLLRTATSWALRPRHKHMRPFAGALVRGLRDHVTGHYGAPSSFA